jgi:hypothetical protein
MNTHQLGRLSQLNDVELQAIEGGVLPALLYWLAGAIGFLIGWFNS